MSTLTRPRLGSRAISDMQPLMNPSLNTNDKEKNLGRGTHAISGGARVFSGGRTALGGIAPMSPFLPLPPAMEQEEVDRQQYDLSMNATSNHNNFLSVQSQASIHLRSSSGSKVKGENIAPMSRGGHLRPAPMMIRSYSMPVATQSDYEAQREAIKRRHQFATAQNKVSSTEERPWEANWVQDTQVKGRPLYHTTTSMKLKMNHNNAMTNSISSMGSAKESAFSPKKKPSPRSPLSIITINEHPFSSPILKSNSGIEMDLGSGSDEALTPRASSPHDDYFSKSIKVDIVETRDALSDFIHPDHFQPPPAFGF